MYYQRKQSGKFKFKACVRKVLANYEWLGEVDEEELGENVMKNIQMLRMKKKDKKSLLSLYDKVILNKSIKIRTDEEKMHLARILSNLKCFRKYTPGVRQQLAASTYYVFYRAGRDIVKQFHEAHALYFIITGTVNVKQQYQDPVTGELQEKVIGTMESGDMFGEVSLLHDIPRTATIETATTCDLLMLKRHDFDRVLKNTVKEEWDAVLRAIQRFTYFENFNEIDKRECCILSRIRLFPKDTVILGQHPSNFVHFLLKGEASLLIQVVEDEMKYLRNEGSQPFMPAEYLDMYRSRTKQVKIPEGDKEEDVVQQKAERKSERLSKSSKRATVQELMGSSSKSIRAKSSKMSGTKKSTSSTFPQAASFLGKFTRLLEDEFNVDNSKSVIFPLHAKSHIMHIAELKELACFGVGEDLKSKIILAKTDVTCLLVPYFWLIQRNYMTWLEIKNFWEKVLPTNQQLIDEIKKSKKWEAYKRKLCRVGTPFNYEFNVPYSIRIHDTEACSF